MQKLIKFLSIHQLLVLIIILAAALRFYNISGTPPSLNWDEVSHGYNAYSILKTGKDEWGVSFPTIFRAYGDYKLPVYIYATALSEFIFGLNSFSVRLPSVLAGIGSVLFTFLLAGRLFDKRAAFLAALLMAVEPWGLFLSRGAFEANLSLFLILAGFYSFIIGLKRHKILLLSSLFFGLSLWTYNSSRIFVPLLLVTLALIYKKELLKVWEKNKKLFTFCLPRTGRYWSIVLFAFFFVPMLWQLFTTTGQARYGWVAIIDEGAVSEINNLRSKSGLSPDLSRLIYNKATFFLYRFGQNWFSHFSPDFLFVKGGTNYQFNIPGHGLLYPINALFFIAGIIILLKKQDKISWLLLSWLLLAPIPSSLTREAPHTLRAVTMLPVPMIITALGLNGALDRFRRLSVPLTIAYIVLLSVFVEGYLTNYFTKYRVEYSWAWQYGYQGAVDYVKENYGRYDKVIVTKKYGEPHEFFLFYGTSENASWLWEPTKYRNDPNLIRFYQSNWYWVDRFDKFYFVNDWDVPKTESGIWNLESGGTIPMDNRTLLITSPGNYPRGWRHLKTINFLDGKPVFDILENRT